MGLHGRTASIAALLVSFSAHSADIVLTPPSGSGVSMTDPIGSTTRFRVGGDGVITLPGLGPVTAASGLCLDSSGRIGTCSTPSTSSGTVTSVGTSVGSGITLSPNPITTMGSIAADTTVLQSRVSGACAAGSSIRAIAANGTVTCQADNAGPTNAIVQGGNAFGAAVEATLGTTDNNAVNIVANNARVARFGPTAGAPNIAFGHPSNVAGGVGIVGATVGGGGDAGFINSATGPWATIAGGVTNLASGSRSTVAGGDGNKSEASYSFVGGGRLNAASAPFGAVGGGERNTTGGSWSTVSGGDRGIAGGDYSAVGGGQFNNALNTASTVAGGIQNIASGNGSTIGGGGSSTASGISSTIGGGNTNEASGNQSTVGGGLGNIASGSNSTVAGGQGNVASNNWSMVPGGSQNIASGEKSFAAGYRAKTQTADATPAVHHGVFLWSDSFENDFHSIRHNEFAARANGGVRFVTAIVSGVPTAGVSVAPGGGSWASISDRAAKKDIAPVDARSILKKVAAMPVYAWRYVAEASGARHIGPVAQDFRAAFGLGDSDKTIATVDADGVALAAIQGLYQLLEEKDHKAEQQAAQIEGQRLALARQRELIAELQRDRELQKARMDALERAIGRGERFAASKP